MPLLSIRVLHWLAILQVAIFETCRQDRRAVLSSHRAAIQNPLPLAANHQPRRYAADDPTRLNGAVNAVKGFFGILPACF